MKIKDKDILTVPEVAEYLNYSRLTVLKYIQEGVLPATRLKPRGRWRIKREDFEKLLKKGQRNLKSKEN